MAKLAITFEQWRKDVDTVLIRLSGTVGNDLPDYDYQTAYSEHKGPVTTARAVLRAAKEY